MDPVAVPPESESDQKLLIKNVDASVRDKFKSSDWVLKSDSPIIVTIEGPIVKVNGLVISRWESRYETPPEIDDGC